MHLPAHPNLYVKRKIPAFPNGGYMFGFPRTPCDNRAATFLREHTTYAGAGRTLLDDLPNDAYVFEGRAKRGEDFGFALWEGGSISVWTIQRQQRFVAPAILSLSNPCNLGPCGSWTCEHFDTDRHDLGPVLLPSKASWFHRHQHDTTTHPYVFATEHHPNVQEADVRAATIVRTSLIQALSDYARDGHKWPKVVAPDALYVPKDATRPAWWTGKGTMIPEAERNRILSTFAFPTIAKAYIRDTSLERVDLTIRMGMRTGLGLLEDPHLEVSAQGARKDTNERVSVTLHRAFAKAWNTPVFGDPYAWYHHHHDGTRVSITPSTLSKHQILALIATAP